MSQSQAATAVALLEEQRTTLLADVRSRLHAEGQAGPLGMLNHIEETGDWVEANTANLQDLALLQHEIDALVAIDAALARARSGQYGQCQVCGQPIAAERLAVQPAALACHACQSQIEHRQALRA